MRVYIIDDHELIHRGLAHLFGGTRIQIVGQAQDVISLDVYNISIDCLLCDINLPSEKSFVFLKNFREELPETKIVIFSSNISQYTVHWATRMGIYHIVSKQDDSSYLLNAVLSQEESFYSPSVRSFASPSRLLLPLTLRQKEICRKIHAGQTSKEIAKGLGLSLKTVEYHRLSVCEKLKMKSGGELIQFLAKNPHVFESDESDE